MGDSLGGDAAGAAGVALNAATGNWIGAAIGAVGLGMQIFGSASSSSDTAKATAQQNAISAQQTANAQDQAQQEQGINGAKQQAMELAGRRQQMEIVRTAQRARAAAVQAGTNQGAQFGSGMAGGLAQVTDQSLFNLSGVNDALQTGRQIAGFNSNITQDRYTAAGLQGQMNVAQANEKSTLSTDAGYASLGGALLKSGPTIGALSKGFGLGA